MTTATPGAARVVLDLCSAEQLVGVGHRDPAHDAVRVRLVVAHPPERRRVAVDRDRRRPVRVADAVDVARRRSRTRRRPRAGSSARGSSRPRHGGRSPRRARPRRRRRRPATGRGRGSRCPGVASSRSARRRRWGRGRAAGSGARRRRGVIVVPPERALGADRVRRARASSGRARSRSGFRRPLQPCLDLGHRQQSIGLS